MKKIIFVLACFSVLAQSRAQFLLGPVLGLELPAGNFGNNFRTGVGFGVTGKYFLNEKMAIGGLIHYAHFSEIQPSGYYDSWNGRVNVIPVSGLFEYYFLTDNPKVYGGGDLGIYNYSYYWNGSYQKWNPAKGWQTYPDTRSGTDTFLGLAPFFGAAYAINEKMTLDGNLKFNWIVNQDSHNYFGLNVGLLFNLSK